MKVFPKAHRSRYVHAIVPMFKYQWGYVTTWKPFTTALDRKYRERR